MRNATCIPLAILALLPALAGCSLSDLKQGYPDRRYYDLRAERPGSAVAPPADATVLHVRRFRMSPRFEGVELVTRRDEVAWESDFYNVFLVAPSSILTEETRRWLAGAGLFGQVLDTGSVVAATHVLEGTGSALYADAAAEGGPRAVLELNVTLADVRAEARLVFRKAYRREVPIPSTAPEAAVRGWNAGLAGILGELEKDLRGTPRNP